MKWLTMIELTNRFFSSQLLLLFGLSVNVLSLPPPPPPTTSNPNLSIVCSRGLYLTEIRSSNLSLSFSLSLSLSLSFSLSLSLSLSLPPTPLLSHVMSVILFPQSQIVVSRHPVQHFIHRRNTCSVDRITPCPHIMFAHTHCDLFVKSSASTGSLRAVVIMRGRAHRMLTHQFCSACQDLMDVCTTSTDLPPCSPRGKASASDQQPWVQFPLSLWIFSGSSPASGLEMGVCVVCV